MGIAENLVGQQLQGTKHKWMVIERIQRDEDKSGAFHSVGYKVKSEKGESAFMKVTDLDLLTDNDATMLQRLQTAIQAHTIERDMLQHCRGNNMDRIVLALDFGEAMLTLTGSKEPIFYLVFELAECDVRVHVDRRTQFKQSWTFGALHDLSVAIQQLHAGDINHNDIKPENFLVFRPEQLKESLQKLSDLGCATSPSVKSIYDEEMCVGDPRYAAPEILYGSTLDPNLRTFDARRAMDIYHLGSMLAFLTTGRMLTPEVIRRLAPEHRPPTDSEDWNGSLELMMPYWREAFTRVLEDFQIHLPKDASGALSGPSQQLLHVLKELGEPNPNLRGDPKLRHAHGDRLGLQRYISLFADLRLKVLH